MIMQLRCETDLPPQCPPGDAVSNDINPVFRYIESDTLQESDFLNHKEKNSNYPPGMECEALAVSFYTTIEAADNLAKKFKKFRTKKLLSGRITTECGLHKTENEHLNLWIFKNVDMVKVFLGGGDEDEDRNQN